MATVTNSLKAFVEDQSAARGYGNVSEYFPSLPREAQEQEQETRLEALLLEGLASNGIPLDDRFHQGLEARIAQILDRHKDRACP